jgi:hypothetical protein
MNDSKVYQNLVTMNTQRPCIAPRDVSSKGRQVHFTFPSCSMNIGLRHSLHTPQSLFGDLGLFTCRESFGAYMTDLFNFLTGYTWPSRS